ncbi:MAG: hypothetical protein KGV59_01410 [Tenacibaculum sp.]|nr:hypothetical protein [Tenacibaculum sp.]
MKGTFLGIVNYLENLAKQHEEINSCYRWNVNEVTGAFRKGVELPVMLIDAVETQTQGDKVKTFHNHTTAFTILGKPNTRTGNLDDYEAQNEVLELCQQICFDMETRILSERFDSGFLVDKNSFHFFKVGPVFVEGLCGYRCEFSVKNKACCGVNPLKWNDID